MFSLVDFFRSSLRRQILLAFGVILVLTLLLSFLALWQLAQIHPQAQRILRISEMQSLTSRIRFALDDLQDDLERYILFRSPEYRQNLERERMDIQTALQTFNEISDPELLPFQASLSSSFETLQRDMEILLNSETLNAGDANRLGLEMFDTVSSMLQEEQNLANLLLERSQALEQQQVNTVSRVQAQIFFAGLVIVALSAVTSFFVNSRLQRIAVLTDAAIQIEKGNLNQYISVQEQDEIGILSSAFNTMIARFRDLLQTLEARVAERTKALQTSLEVSRRLSGATDPRQLAVDVVEQLQAAFGYYHAHIYYQDEATGDLVMAGGTGEAGAAMLAAGHRIPQGRGLVGRAAETRAPVLVPDVSQAIGWLPNPLLPETQSEAAVPILAGDRVLGVLDVQQNRINGLTEEDVMLLQSIASQVAISLQNARAYQASAERAEMEAAVNYLAQRIQRASSVQETLQTVIRETAQVLGAKRISVKLIAPSERKS